MISTVHRWLVNMLYVFKKNLVCFTFLRVFVFFSRFYYKSVSINVIEISISAIFPSF